ncbi:hypothetical protein J437_LFUL015693 [Ladona fulva]|uniref:Uncharacterized protein n=1 Tax=Ladona fulva TaxID=123851 RepID=A0A8K0KLH6_LADFU|nr:hypothetical protein J437_LFUL015693 [Ladona fulva]
MQLPKGVCAVTQGNTCKDTPRPVMEVKDKVTADVRKLLDKYRELFEDQLGKIKEHKATNFWRKRASAKGCQQSITTLDLLPMPTTIRLSRECKFVNLVMGGKVEDLALSTKILHQVTAKDPVLSKIKRFVDLGWPMQNVKVELKPYFERREEISVECRITLWGNRMSDAGNQDLRLQRFLLSYRNTPHATTGKAPAVLFLSNLHPTRLDHLKPDPRNKMEIEVWKQKVYHNANVRAHFFRQGDEVWVKNECNPGWHSGVVERKTGKLSYEVLISGQMNRKHADQLHSRSGAMDYKPTQSVVHQQQEIEVQESQLPQQQLREQDLRPQPEVETQSLRK